jgi:hypothetical protein
MGSPPVFFARLAAAPATIFFRELIHKTSQLRWSVRTHFI